MLAAPEGYYDMLGAWHLGRLPMQVRQPMMTPQNAQAQVAAHVATQPTGQGVLVRGQPRQVASVRTGDPQFEFDVNAAEFLRR